MYKAGNTLSLGNLNSLSVTGCSIPQRNRNTTSPMNSVPRLTIALTGPTTTGSSSTTPTLRWEAVGVPLIAFRLNLNRDSDKSWSRIVSMSNTSFISSLSHVYDEDYHEKT